MDKRVEIHGSSRVEMNGNRGVATDFHPIGGITTLPAGVIVSGCTPLNGDRTTWRYTVKLDSGEVFKVKPANVREVFKTKAKGKAKGKEKGKKARAVRKK